MEFIQGNAFAMDLSGFDGIITDPPFNKSTASNCPVEDRLGETEFSNERFISLADAATVEKSFLIVFANFPNADALDYWTGLTPDNKSSAGRTQSGKITKAGNATLRWALGKAAVCMALSDPRQKAIRKRLIGRIGKAKANVAMARRLNHILYAMVREGKPFEKTGSTNHNRKANAARKRRKTAKSA